MMKHYSVLLNECIEGLSIQEDGHLCKMALWGEEDIAVKF